MGRVEELRNIKDMLCEVEAHTKPGLDRKTQEMLREVRDDLIKALHEAARKEHEATRKEFETRLFGGINET